MPRKKPVEPDPLQVIEDNGVIIGEVRDETCWVMSRGAHRTLQYNRDRLDPALKWAADKYFGLDTKGNRSVQPNTDFMKSAAKFCMALQLAGHYPAGDRDDDSSLRKKLYKDVKLHITALERGRTQASSSG